MRKKIIYVSLQGRIGNQLFIYAFAKKIHKMLPNHRLIINDSEVLGLNWVNSLKEYQLEDTEFTQENLLRKLPQLRLHWILRKIYRTIAARKSYHDKFEWEKKWQPLWNKWGMILCENGYLPTTIPQNKDIYIEGFFQSEKYFSDIEQELRAQLQLKDAEQLCRYPNIDQILNRNTVCISIKVEHNVGSEMYDVCLVDYWRKGIEYICAHVEDPLFFICSDNVDYVLENLIDTSRYDYICQSKEVSVATSLAAMNECKHFIIGNTTYGWWAQYLSDYPDKIVIAPSKWMKIDMPIDIYQDNWTLIGVEE